MRQAHPISSRSTQAKDNSVAIRPIVIHGNPVLHRPAAPVTEFNDELKELVADMYETMDASNGVGLAAPQIGVGLRIFTYKMENEDGKECYFLGGEILDEGNSDATDIAAAERGYISVTPLQTDLTDYLYLEKLLR